jgi:hypothetical protein
MGGDAYLHYELVYHIMKKEHNRKKLFCINDKDAWQREWFYDEITLENEDNYCDCEEEDVLTKGYTKVYGQEQEQPDTNDVEKLLFNVLLVDDVDQIVLDYWLTEEEEQPEVIYSKVVLSSILTLYNWGISEKEYGKYLNTTYPTLEYVCYSDGEWLDFPDQREFRKRFGLARDDRWPHFPPSLLKIEVRRWWEWRY